MLNDGPIRGYDNSDLENFVSDIDRFGFVDRSQTTISFDSDTYVFTLARTGTYFEYYILGQLCVITTDKTLQLPGSPPDAATYHIYINTLDGTLSYSLSDWDLTENYTLVAIIIFNSTLIPKYILLDERHTCKIDRSMHRYLHFSRGTQVITPGTLSDYSVPVAGPSGNDDNTFSITSCVIADEDIFHTLDSITDPDGDTLVYPIVYRTSSTEWSWVLSEVPFRYTAAGYIQWDNVGTMTQGSSANYYNTYLLAATNGYIIISGRGEFASLATAQAENFSLFDMTGFEIEEAIAIYQFTWLTNNAYSTRGKCKLAATPANILISITSGKVKK